MYRVFRHSVHACSHVFTHANNNIYAYCSGQLPDSSPGRRCDLILPFLGTISDDLRETNRRYFISELLKYRFSILRVASTLESPPHVVSNCLNAGDIAVFQS